MYTSKLFSGISQYHPNNCMVRSWHPNILIQKSFVNYQLSFYVTNSNYRNNSFSFIYVTESCCWTQNRIMQFVGRNCENCPEDDVSSPHNDISRKDAKCFIYISVRFETKKKKFQWEDCSHTCIAGIPQKPCLQYYFVYRSGIRDSSNISD